MTQKRIKFGFDPTGSSIHLGRTIPLLRLREMQDKENATVILIVGDFTAKIGDPSDKLGKRPSLSNEEIEENIHTSLPLIFKILDESKTEIRRNSEWLNQTSIHTIMRLMSAFSIQQMTARRNFNIRMKNKEPIYMHELLYPIMQGYDSYIVDSTMEIGGEDQIFNMNIGRDIQALYGKPQQEVIVTPLLVGTDGEKMSTSAGNTINIDEDADVMFDKVMSIRDDVSVDYAKLCTRMEVPEVIEDFRAFKINLANEICKMYYPQWKTKIPEYRKKI